MFCSVACVQSVHAFLHILSSANGTSPQSGVSVRDAVRRQAPAHDLTAQRMSGLATAGLVYNAERINGVLGRHWRRFAGQDYFDKHGVFFCALVSTPLLLDMFVILVRRPVAQLPGAAWRASGVACSLEWTNNNCVSTKVGCLCCVRASSRELVGSL